MTVVFDRTTVAEPVRIEGIGLFTGRPSAVTIEPADAAGIVFVRGGNEIPATIGHLSTEPAHPAFGAMPPRNSSVGVRGSSVHTVEHVLAAIRGLGITDARIVVEGDELPIGDGSANLFTTPIVAAGVRSIVAADKTATPIRLAEPIFVERDGSSVLIEPSDAIEYCYRLDYGTDSPIPQGDATWDGSADSFVQGVAPARTFCLQEEAEAMHAAGLFKHLTPRDMLVFGPSGPIDNELLFSDEPARHKLLDLIGDLALVGRPLLARVVATRSGHALHHEVARQVCAKTSTY